MLFSKKKIPEAVLVIESNQDNSSALFFTLSDERVKISHSFTSPGSLPDSLFEVFKEVRKSLPKVVLKTIVISLDKELAYSFLSRGTFLREKIKYPVNQQELEVSLQRAERQLYEKHRELAKWQLKTKIEKISFGFLWLDKVFIDDHLVKNPIGFKGKSIGFLVGNTFLEASFLDKLEEEISLIYQAYFRSLGKKDSASRSTGKLRTVIFEKKIVLIQFLSSLPFYKFLFLDSEKNEISLTYIDSFFGSSDFFTLEQGLESLLLSKIKEKFSVDENSAEKILRLFKEKKISRSWQKELELIEREVLEAFVDFFYYLFKKIPKFRLSNSERMLIYPENPLWPNLPNLIRKFLKEKKNFETKLRIKTISLDEFEKEVGLKLDLDNHFSPKEKLFFLSYLFLAKKFEKEDEMSRVLRKVARRII